jgi:hypothetical protein
LLLNGRFPIPPLPRVLRRVLGWPLLSGGVLLMKGPTDGRKSRVYRGECYTIVEVFAAKRCIHHPYLER